MVWTKKTDNNKEQIITGEPGFRVFLQTVEVTEDVTQIVTTWSTSSLMCVIELGNLNNKYVITAKNLAGEWKLPEEEVKQKIFEDKAERNNKNPFNITREQDVGWTDEEYRKIINSSTGNKYIDVPGVSPFLSTTPKKYNFEQRERYSTNVYDLYEGDCIFNAGDTVKVFVKDPFTEDWYYNFTGYATPVTDSYNSEADKRVISLHCEDTKRWIKHTRLQFGVWGDDNAPINEAFPEQVQEKAWRTIWNEVGADKTISQIFTSLLTGELVDVSLTPEQEQEEKKKEETTTEEEATKADKYSLHGCGNFKMSEWEGLKSSVKAENGVVYVDNKTDLESVQNVLFDSLKIKPDGDTTSVEEYRKAIHIKIDELGTDKSTGKWLSSKIYNVDGEVRIILPEFFRNEDDIIPHNVKSNIDYRDSFKSRLAILNDVTDKIDFRFYASPNGDIILEFPQYDMNPSTTKTTTYTTKGPVLENMSIGGDYGEKGEEVFTMDEKEIMSWEFTEGDDNMVTMVLAGGSFTQYEQQVSDQTKVAGKFAGASKPELVSRFGWRATEIDHGLITTREGLKIMAQHLLNKSIADMKTMHAVCTPKFEAWISRPYKIWDKNYLGFCTQIVHTIVWGSQIRTDLNLNSMRGWNTIRKEYTSIGGDLVGGIFNYGEAFRGKNEKPLPK